MAEDDKPWRNKTDFQGFPIEVSKRQLRYIELAKNMAKQSEYGKLKHGAVLVKGGSVLSASFNKDKYSSFGARFRDPNNGHATHHAELGCVLAVDKSKISGATMYVVRINNHGEFRLSKPCPMCHQILKHCGVKRVIYSTSEEKFMTYKI